MVDYIDGHRDGFGVEPICRVLQAAPSTYCAAKRRQVNPSTRARRDAVMGQLLMVLWVTNRKVYGAHKLWKAALRAGHDIGRDQVARLMRELGIERVAAIDVAKASGEVCVRVPGPAAGQQGVGGGFDDQRGHGDGR